MQLDIKGTELDLTPSLKTYIETKLLSLSRFVKKYETAGEIHLFVEIARTTKHHHKGNVYFAELMMELPKSLLRAEATNSDVRAAIDEAKDVLKTEITRYKEKQLTAQREKRIS